MEKNITVCSFLNQMCSMRSFTNSKTRKIKDFYTFGPANVSTELVRSNNTIELIKIDKSVFLDLKSFLIPGRYLFHAAVDAVCFSSSFLEKSFTGTLEKCSPLNFALGHINSKLTFGTLKPKGWVYSWATWRSKMLVKPCCALVGLKCFKVFSCSTRVCCVGSVSSDSHVFHGDILENLAVVDVPDRLVVPDFWSQEDGSEHDALPVGRANVDLGVSQEPLQIHLTRRKKVSNGPLLMHKMTIHKHSGFSAEYSTLFPFRWIISEADDFFQQLHSLKLSSSNRQISNTSKSLQVFYKSECRWLRALFQTASHGRSQLQASGDDLLLCVLQGDHWTLSTTCQKHADLTAFESNRKLQLQVYRSVCIHERVHF